MPHRQGNLQSPLVFSKSNNLLRASSIGIVGAIVRIGNGVGVSVAVGVNVDGIFVDDKLPIDMVGVVKEGVAAPLDNGEQLVAIVTKSNKLNH